MNFRYSDEQLMIREAAQTYLADRCSSESVRAAMQLPQGFDPAVWNDIAQELGWCGIPVPEDCGGLGLGTVELALVQEQAGYRLLPSPFFSNVCLATNVLLACGDDSVQQSILPAVASGELRLSCELPSATNFTVLKATSQSGQWQLEGELPRVPDAQGADDLLVVGQTEAGDLALFGVSAAQDGLTVEALDTWDASRRFCRVQFNAVQAERCSQGDISDGLRRSLALARLYLAAEQLGCAQRCLDLTVEYVMERKQFGRAVGSFQAVKHRCAEMMVAVESTRSAVVGAAALACSAPTLDELEAETAATRALATESLQYCAAEAIQLHGGVGFTWEYDPQLFFKRAQASTHWLGTPEQLRGLIAAQLLD